MKISLLDTASCLVGEGPVWDVREQALYFVDIVGKKVFRYSPETGETRSWDVPGMIGSLALREKGGAIVALKEGVYALDFGTGKASPLALAEGQASRVQFNDGKVDRRGRFVVGSGDSDLKDTQPVGTLYSLGADHRLTELDHGIAIANGPCWSPDNKTFYFSDSLQYEVYAYDYDIDTGAATNRRVFANTRELGGIPDGATVDTDGLIWIAICEGSKIVAFRPDGKIERIIQMPVKAPASVMFGGPNLDRLFVTTINVAALMGRDAQEGAGSTFVIDGLGAKGIAEPRYAG